MRMARHCLISDEIMIRPKAVIITVLVAAGVITVFIQQQAQVELSRENRLLRQQLAEFDQMKTANEKAENSPSVRRISTPRLPAPKIQATAARSSGEDLQSTNLIAGLLNGADPPKLTAEQVESYLRENRRNASSLLAAFRDTGDLT